MKYKFENMSNKSKEGVLDEVSKGLADIAFYYQTTLGFPLEVFEEMLEEKCPTNSHKIAFYMKFKNEKPEIFK